MALLAMIDQARDLRQTISGWICERYAARAGRRDNRNGIILPLTVIIITQTGVTLASIELSKLHQVEVLGAPVILGTVRQQDHPLGSKRLDKIGRAHV